MNRRLISSLVWLLVRSLGVGFGYTITLMLAGMLLVMFNLISVEWVSTLRHRWCRALDVADRYLAALPARV